MKKWVMTQQCVILTNLALRRQLRVLSGQLQAAANIACLNLQWHPLEPAGREEDDRRHQLAAQSGADHDLEPRLHGDTHTFDYSAHLKAKCSFFICAHLSFAFEVYALFVSLQPPSIMAFPATTPTGMMGYGMVSIMADILSVFRKWCQSIACIVQNML